MLESQQFLIILQVCINTLVIGQAKLFQMPPEILNIRINVMQEKLLTRKGNDLYLEVYVPFTTLLLGGTIMVPTLEGEFELEIKELTQSGTVMRIKNKGAKILHKETRGDLLVTLKAESPKSLDKKTKEVLKSIQDSISVSNYPKYKKYTETPKDVKWE